MEPFTNLNWVKWFIIVLRAHWLKGDLRAFSTSNVLSDTHLAFDLGSAILSILIEL